MQRYFGWMVLLLVLVPAFAIGKQHGKITGILYDSEGAEFPKVTVTIKSQALIEGPRTLLTEADGSFTFKKLKPGLYTLTASTPGFETYNRTGIQVAIGKTSSLYITMTPTTEMDERDKGKIDSAWDFTTSDCGWFIQSASDVPTERTYQDPAALLPVVGGINEAIVASEFPLSLKLPAKGQQLEEILLPMPPVKENNGALLLSGKTPTLVVDGQTMPIPLRKSSRR
jgi:hypothetical protein